MLKLITFNCLFFLTFSSFASSEESFLCSAYYAKSIARNVDSSEYSDKYKHCAVSCMLTLRCGAIDTYQTGLLKEVLDLLGMGHPEMDDIKANVTGIKLVTSKKARTDNECLIKCGEIY